VPGPNEAFTGRDGMLVRLRDGLQGSGRSVVHALHGAGGVGKTQLAAEYARRFAGNYDAVWWVNAERADRVVGAASCTSTPPGPGPTRSPPRTPAWPLSPSRNAHRHVPTISTRSTGRPQGRRTRALERR